MVFIVITFNLRQQTKIHQQERHRNPGMSAFKKKNNVKTHRKKKQNPTSSRAPAGSVLPGAITGVPGPRDTGVMDPFMPCIEGLLTSPETPPI